MQVYGFICLIMLLCPPTVLRQIKRSSLFNAMQSDICISVTANLLSLSILHQNLLLQSGLALNLWAKSYTKLHSTAARTVERKRATGGEIKRKSVRFHNSPSKPNLQHLKTEQNQYGRLLLTRDIDNIWSVTIF